MVFAAVEDECDAARSEIDHLAMTAVVVYDRGEGPLTRNVEASLQRVTGEGGVPWLVRHRRRCHDRMVRRVGVEPNQAAVFSEHQPDRASDTIDGCEIHDRPECRWERRSRQVRVELSPSQVTALLRRYVP